VPSELAKLCPANCIEIMNREGPLVGLAQPPVTPAFQTLWTVADGSKPGQISNKVG